MLHLQHGTTQHYAELETFESWIDSRWNQHELFTVGVWKVTWRWAAIVAWYFGLHISGYPMLFEQHTYVTQAGPWRVMEISLYQIVQFWLLEAAVQLWYVYSILDSSLGVSISSQSFLLVASSSTAESAALIILLYDVSKHVNCRIPLSWINLWWGKPSLLVFLLVDPGQCNCA